MHGHSLKTIDGVVLQSVVQSTRETKGKRRREYRRSRRGRVGGGIGRGGGEEDEKGQKEDTTSRGATAQNTAPHEQYLLGYGTP